MDVNCVLTPVAILENCRWIVPERTTQLFAHKRQCSKIFSLRRQKTELLRYGSLAYLFVNHHILVLVLPASSVGGVSMRTTRLLAVPTRVRNPVSQFHTYNRGCNNREKPQILAVIRFQSYFVCDISVK